MKSNFTQVPSIVITFNETGQRIDKILGNHSAIGSRSRAEKLIKMGQIRVNGNLVKSSFKVSVGDKIEFELFENSEHTVGETVPSHSLLKPLNVPLKILYEDHDLAVINKPSGIVMHPAAGHEQDTLVNVLVHHIEDLSMGFKENRPGIVHRLDRDTSGLIVIAKNDISHARLAEQFQKRTIFRIYWAVVFGRMKSSSGTITSRLGRHPRDRKKFASIQKNGVVSGHLKTGGHEIDSRGKIAITTYQTMASHGDELSLLKLKLETGRTHQIRVHLSEAQHAIVGDWVYGSKGSLKNLKSIPLRREIENLPRFALHAAELGFEHPGDRRFMKFKEAWPQELNFLLEHCGWNDVEI